MRLLLLLRQPDDPIKWVILGGAAFVLVYLAVLRPMLRGGKKRDPLERAPAQGGLAQQRALERDMQHLMVEYEQMIRTMTAALDTRAAKLEVLIKEADEKMSALRAASAAAAAAAGSGFADSAGVVAAATSPASPDNVLPAAAAVAPVAGPDARHVEIYDLADQGVGAREIARRLGRPNGEIELILALRAGNE